MGIKYTAALKGQGNMAQSLAKIIIHIVFSTKNRESTFQDELIMLLKKHKIEFDERYLWM